jgi:hypothetical protein
MSKTQHTREFLVDQGQPFDRVTATEIIDGVQHLLVLEQDETGCYREVILEPLRPCDEPALEEALL